MAHNIPLSPVPFAIRTPYNVLTAKYMKPDLFFLRSPKCIWQLFLPRYFHHNRGSDPLYTLLQLSTSYLPYKILIKMWYFAISRHPITRFQSGTIFFNLQPDNITQEEQGRRNIVENYKFKIDYICKMKWQLYWHNAIRAYNTRVITERVKAMVLKYS